MTVYTDRKLNHHRPDITLVRKDTQEWTLSDIAVLAGQNIISTEEEKVDNRYQDLAFEIKRYPQSIQSDSITNSDWCSWDSLKERQILTWKVRHS